MVRHVRYESKHNMREPLKQSIKARLLRVELPKRNLLLQLVVKQGLGCLNDNFAQAKTCQALHYGPTNIKHVSDFALDFAKVLLEEFEFKFGRLEIKFIVTLQGRDVALADQFVVLVQALEHALNRATKALPMAQRGKSSHTSTRWFHWNPAQHVYESSFHL